MYNIKLVIRSVKRKRLDRSRPHKVIRAGFPDYKIALGTNSSIRREIVDKHKIILGLI